MPAQGLMRGGLLLGVMLDIALRQRLLKFLDTSVGDSGVVEPQPFETSQLFQVLQSRVVDVGFAEIHLHHDLVVINFDLPTFLHILGML